MEPILSLVALAGGCGVVAWGYWKTLQAGDLPHEVVDELARDLVYACAMTAAGPWVRSRIHPWLDSANLSGAHAIQVLRYAHRMGWLQIPGSNPISVAARVPETEVRLTQQGYDMIHHQPSGPSISFGGPVIGNPTIAQSGRDQQVAMTVHTPHATAPDSIDWPALVAALRQDEPHVPTYDRVVVKQIINDITDAGHDGPEPRRAHEILTWLRDKVGAQLATNAGNALWSATAAFLQSLGDH